MKDVKQKMVHKNLTARVYEIIRDMIITRKLKPAQKITEENLATEIGVSRTPVKIVLARLNEEGLIEVVPRRGTYVKKFLFKDALPIYDVREVIEGLAAKLAASSITDKEIRQMTKVFEKAKEFIEKKDLGAYRKADIKFHELLAQASKNEIICKILSTFRLQINSINVGLVRSLSKTLREHLAIIDALARHKADLAEKLAREHVRTTRQRIIDKSISKKENV